MPPTLALFLTIGFIVFLFRRDFRERPNISAAIWLPLIWFFLIASKPVSAWLHILGLPIGGAVSLEEGSPLDACVYLSLIVAGCYVLNQRRINVGEIIENNPWLTAFFIYCFLAVVWSDFPLVSFKRWIKVLGHPIMVLILFAEPNFEDAFTTVMKRAAYVLTPVSILFIKYYPEWGRRFDPFSGEAMNIGIAASKNMLGAICFLLGLFFVWHLLRTLQREKSKSRKRELLTIVFFLWTIAYLLRKAHSVTSALSLLASVLIIIILGLRLVNKKVIGMYAVSGVVLFVIAQLTFDVFGHIVEMSGHNSTIEGRQELWQELLHIKINPLIGTGFESFWLGERLQKLWDEHWWHPNEAHNGYLETYLNLGLVGLLMLMGLILATFWKCKQDLLRNPLWGRLGIGFVVAIVIYNWTEASFKALSPLWFFFYVIAIRYPESLAPAAQNSDLDFSEEEREHVSVEAL